MSAPKYLPGDARHGNYERASGTQQRAERRARKRLLFVSKPLTWVPAWPVPQIVVARVRGISALRSEWAGAHYGNTGFQSAVVTP